MRRSIAQLSGGEKKRVALALGLGFAEVVAARGRLTSNILVLDEVRVYCPARVPHPEGYRVPELTEGDLNRPTDMKGMVQENRV
jgi:hypothetical protein